MTDTTSYDGGQLIVSPSGVIDAGAASQVTSPEVDPIAYDAIVEAGMVTRSGARVTRDNMLQVSAVWQAVDMIAGSLARMKLLLMEENGGRPQEQQQSDTYWRFAHQPMRYMHAVRFWRFMWECRLIWGRAYAAIVRNQRGVQELLPLLPDRTYLDRTGDGEQIYLTELNGVLLWIPYADIFHLQGITDHYTWDGMDPMRKAREQIGKALARMNFASTFFRHGGRVGGILELPSSMPKPHRDSQESSFRKVYENAEEAFRTVVLRANAKFHAAQQTLQETQMVESGTEDVREIARYFNLNPGRLGVEGGRAYNSKTEDNRDYLDTTLSPHMSFAIAEAEEKCLPESDRRFRRRWFKYDTRSLLAMSTLDRYRSYEIGIRSEFLSPNECRASEDLPPRPGGNRYGNPAINPAAHIELIEGICNRQLQIIRDRLGRRKTEPDARFCQKAQECFEAALVPTMRAYSEVFGGDPEKMAAELSRRYVLAVAINSEDTTNIIREVTRCQSMEGSATGSPKSSSSESSGTIGATVSA